MSASAISMNFPAPAALAGEDPNPQARVAPLCGALAAPVGGPLADDKTFRRYRAGVIAYLPEDASFTPVARSIFYEVGRHFPSARALLGAEAAAAVPIDCSIDTNPAEAANFETLARRYSNFASQWAKMDLCGVAERLAMAIASVSLYGGTSTTTMRGGLPIRVTALNTLDAPQTASINSVFLPRTVDSVGADSVFAVLCAAANGCGASVTTDVLRLDGQNQPVVPAVEGPALASACVEALRVVGANMEASGGGDCFAYAVTRGIHRSVSVVGHSDEGGFVRDLFRTARFRVPYGGVNAALREYPALPALASTSASSVAAWVDGIALKTAAAVAHCDPLVPGPGGLFPTVFSSGHGPVLESGSADVEPTDNDARAIGRLIAADLNRFAPAYIRALSSLFGLRTNSEIAASHFCAVAGIHLQQEGAVNRHLRHKTVAPYFWIEPTSLLDRRQFGTVAEAEGYGSKVGAGSTVSEPCFESFRVLDRGRSANHATVAIKMRSARTSALVCALAAAPAPLSDLRLLQFDTQSVVLPGDQGDVPGTVRAKHQAAQPLSAYLWRRGQSCFPAPAEFVNTHSVYGAKLRLVGWDDDWNATFSDLPSDLDMETSCVAFRVSVPTGIPTAPSNYEDRQAKRARTRAANALSQSVVRARASGLAVSPVMEISEVPPTLDSTPVYRDSEATHGHTDPGPTAVRGQGSGAGAAPPNHGAALPPVQHHQALRGPRMAGGAVNQPQPLTAGGIGGPPAPGPALDPLPSDIPPAAPANADAAAADAAAAPHQ